MSQAFKALHEINNLSEYDSFKLKYADWEISLKIIHPSNGFYSMDWESQKVYTKGKIGDTLYYSLCPECSRNAWKVIDISPKILYKVDFIYLKKANYSTFQLDSITSEIIHKYKDGTPFSQLIEEYSTHFKYVNQPWHCEGSYIEEFEDSILVHKPQEIFTVDPKNDPNRFIIVKTAPDSSAIVPTVIQIKLASLY